MVCTLDTAAVTELWRLDLFSCTSSCSFVLVRCLREANVAISFKGFLLLGTDRLLRPGRGGGGVQKSVVYENRTPLK